MRSGSARSPSARRISICVPGADAAACCCCLRIGMHSTWKRARLETLRRPLAFMALAALGVALVVPCAGMGRLSLASVVGVTARALVVTVGALSSRCSGCGVASAFPRRARHVHRALRCRHVRAGRGRNSAYKIEKDIALQPGQSSKLRDYRFEFVSTRNVPGPNYAGDRVAKSAYARRTHDRDVCIRRSACIVSSRSR